MELNTNQAKFVDYGEGPLFVIAGPGTGKTHSLVCRIKKLLQNGVAGNEILVLTFTRKACFEIKERLFEFENKGCRVHTFHSLAYEHLNRFSDIDIVSNDERSKILRNLKKKYGLDLSDREISLAVSNKKANLLANAGRFVENVLKDYNRLLKQKGLKDYDDLLLDYLRYLKKAKMGYKWVLVDEFQDVNDVQYEILKKFEKETRNINVIGDPNQSIYTFRGSVQSVFKRFELDFPDSERIFFDKNYRNSREIISFSSRLFESEAYKYEPVRQESGRVCVVYVANEYAEARWVVNFIKKRMGGLDLNEVGAQDSADVGFGDFAIIYRTHRIGRIVRKMIEDSGIPHQVVGEESFFENSEVKKVLSILSEKRYFHMKLSVCLEEFLKKDKFVKKSKKFDDFLNYVSLYSDLDVGAFLNIVEDVRRNEYYDKNADLLTIMSMHASKGLEFRFVFLIGFEEGAIPYLKAGEDDGRLDEEKRLLYVAMTRAKDELYLMSSLNRDGANCQVSRYYYELEGVEVERVFRKKSSKRPKTTQMDLF